MHLLVNAGGFGAPTPSPFYGMCHVSCMVGNIRDKWAAFTTAWRFLRLRMEERPPIRWVAANVLNKQSRTADKGWSSAWELDKLL